jgi:hypothetical protein
MRSKHREAFREEQASNHPAESTPSADASAMPFQRIIAPMNVALRAPQPWIQAAEAVVDWYGAMFRLAFGLGRVNSGREPQDSVTARPAPPAEQPKSPSVTPLQSSPAAPVVLRPKRRKSPSRTTSRSRVRRSRRAA